MIRPAILICLFILLAAAPAGPGQTAVERGADLCLLAATDAPHRTGVPPAALESVLMARAAKTAIGTATGAPWPSTVRSGADWHAAAHPELACHLAETQIAAGRDDLHLGCFQINWRHHGAAFGTVERMLDPALNAGYAAAYLVARQGPGGDWPVAGAAP